MRLQMTHVSAIKACVSQKAIKACNNEMASHVEAGNVSHAGLQTQEAIKASSHEGSQHFRQRGLHFKIMSASIKVFKTVLLLHFVNINHQ